MNEKENYSNGLKLIMQLLTQEGLNEDSKHLHDAFYGGSTGNEIISGIIMSIEAVRLDKLSDPTRKVNREKIE